MILVSLLKQVRSDAISVLLLVSFQGLNRGWLVLFQGLNRGLLFSFHSVTIKKNDEIKIVPTSRVERSMKQSGNILPPILVRHVLKKVQ